jgi:hypothetical protein
MSTTHAHIRRNTLRTSGLAIATAALMATMGYAVAQGAASAPAATATTGTASAAKTLDSAHRKFVDASA